LALLGAAVAGLVVWPFALVALAGAALAARNAVGRPGRLRMVATLTTVFTGYVWAVTGLAAVLYP
jgi:hypothetical protein